MIDSIEDRLDSRILGRRHSFRVIGPNGSLRGEKELGILYLLHGLFGNRNNWVELADIGGYAERHSLIIVAPDGEDSWYCDSFSQKGLFEAYLLEEFMPAIESTFPFNGKRGIAGLSMGGYGAVKFAFRRPEQFHFIASSSGAFHAPLLCDSNPLEGWEELKGSVTDVFGESESSTRKANNLFGMIEGVDQSKLPPIFIDCGADDSFLRINREFSRTMTQAGVVHSYLELPGGHDWNYWNRSFERILSLADESLDR